MVSIAKKKSAVFLLAVLLVLTSGTVVQARGNNSTTTSGVMTPYYQYIAVVGASISIGSLGKAISNGYVDFDGDHDLTLTIELQRSTETGWSEVKSWSESFTSGNYHSLEKDYYVTSGHTYRVVTTATIRDGSTVLETGTSTSQEVTY